MATTTKDGYVVIGTEFDNKPIETGVNKMKSTIVAGTALVATAIAGMSVAVVKLGSDFESAFAKTSTLFGDVNVDVENYKNKLVELSNEVNVSASELGNTMYDALSSGIPVSEDMSEALDFLNQNARLAKAGFTDVNSATMATAKILNSYKMGVEETAKVHKILMQVQNYGITTINELSSVMANVTPTASE